MTAYNPMQRWKTFVPQAPSPDPDWEYRAYGPPRDPDAEAWLAAFERLTEPAVIDWWDGSAYILWPGDQLSRAIAQTRTYEPASAALLKNMLSPGCVFLDVGANSGVFTVAAGKWVQPGGKVFAIEPSAREVERLRAAVALNPAAAIEILPMALGAERGEARLSIADSDRAGMNTLASRFAMLDRPPTRYEVVDVRPLDEIAAGWTRLDVIKADVEGAELDLFLGAQSTIERLSPSILFEASTDLLQNYGAKVDQLLAIIRKLSYELFDIDPANARLRQITSLTDAKNQNIVAAPAGRYSKRTARKAKNG